MQVIDWGLAKMVRAATAVVAEDEEPGTIHGLKQTAVTAGSETTVGTALGTLAYMAPEQARGESRLDARADVFGLGAILCEILTGKPPYTGRDMHAVYEQARRGELAEAWARLAARGADGEW